MPSADIALVMTKNPLVGHRTLDFFPAPVMDETVTSVLSRYVARSPGGAQVTLGSLGLPNLRPDNPVPAIRPLLSVLPVGHPWLSVREVNETHTVVPSLLFFAAPTVREKVHSKLEVATRNAPFLILGLSLRKGMRRGLKYCPDCVRDSLEKNGFGCYLRLHQLPYVLICETHRRSLVSGCKVCGHSNPQMGAWHMAAHCECRQPTPYHAIPEGASDECLQSLLWIAKQSEITMRAPALLTNPVSALRARLKATGFGGASSGVSVRLLSEGLRSRFGVSALKLLGCADSDQNLQWTSRILGINNGNAIKDVGRLLCLTGLCCSSITDLEGGLVGEPNPGSVKKAEAKGYSGVRPLKRELMSAAVVKKALDQADQRISRAAIRLGVSPSALATDLMRHRIRVPLQPALTARVGAWTLEQVRERLRAGIPKKQIEADLKISEWTRQLVELDDSSLVDQHRLATIDSLRKRNRSAIEAFIEVNHKVGWSDVSQQCSGPYDWLHDFDSVWLAGVLKQNPRAFQKSMRGLREDWPAIDQRLSVRAEEFVENCIASDVRPQRITRNRILKGIDFNQFLRAEKAAHLPQLVKTLERLVDSDSSYIERRLLWAMSGYRRTGHELSMNRFRRLIAWGAPTVAAHRARIIEVAVELGVPVNIRSLFA